MRLKYGMLAALAYCIPEIIFLQTADYRNIWILYAGCFLFLSMIVLFLVSFNKKRKQNATIESMLFSGIMVTLSGVIISVLFCFLLLVIFVPGFLNYGTPEKLLHAGPSNIIKDKTGGLAFIVFMTTIMGNFSAGSFVCIVFPFSLKRDQTKDKEQSK